jgi:hypothetical protein
MKPTQRTPALAAGISLIMMAIAAGFSYGYVFTNIHMEGDPAATYEQLAMNVALFKAGLAGWLIIFITDLIVTFTLYLFFRETRKNLSLVTAAVRFIYTILLGIALIRLSSVLSTMGEENMEPFQAGQMVLETMGSFLTTWSLGLILFGVHLLGLGYLALLNKKIPDILGYLLLLAGLGYLAVHISKTLIGLQGEVVHVMETALMVPMALGEILLAFWLIIRGGRPRNKVRV